MPRTTGEIAPEGGVQSVVLALRVLETLARAAEPVGVGERAGHEALAHGHVGADRVATCRVGAVLGQAAHTR